MHFPQRFSAYKKTLTGVLVLFLFSTAVTLATPPSSQYSAGDTLDPNCAPGDTNCSVSLVSAIYTDDITITGAGTSADPLIAVGFSPDDDSVIRVKAATTAALSGSPTYSNGTAGVGATLTRGSNGALGTIDGVTLAVDDRILVKNQATTLQNGVYTITDLGSASTPYILTRTTDSDETADLDSQIASPNSGSTNRGRLWGQQTTDPTVGTSAITYVQTTGAFTTQQPTGTQVS